MNTNNIKAYAPKARTDFIAAVTKQAAKYGITESEIHSVEIKGDIALIDGRPFPAAITKPRADLVQLIRQKGLNVVIEQVAYSWFNRLCAIRYMELHDYLGHGRRVLSHPDEGAGFQILEDCLEIELSGLDQAKVRDLKVDGGKDEELYRELLLAQCHALHQAMPFLFEPVDDATELLLPENLTKTDSLIRELVDAVPKEDWANIEIIGWLYQFYISEKKDEVIGKVVKSEDIPAATQLFTPNWIVKYMVQNSLGAQWLATYPDSPLKGQMEYYIEPAEQTEKVNAQLKVITPASLNPEELTLIDPACGSGHILVEAYDLFKAIYLERGYRQRDIAQLILEKNLFGLDIDERAAQLSGFALMMKARADDRRLFGRGVKLNVMALQDSTAFDPEKIIEGVGLTHYGLKAGDLTELKRLFEQATTFGSLIQVPEELAEKLPALKRLSEVTSQDLFVSGALKKLELLMQQAGILAVQYDAVVANPPYMGSKYHSAVLKKYLKDYYDGYEKDFFSAFIARDLQFSKPQGHLGVMSPFVWMFISTHEHLRTRLIDQETVTSLIQLEYSGFEGATVPICAFTLQKSHVDGRVGCYIRLSEFRGSEAQAPKTLEAIRNRDCVWFFETAQDEFRKIPGSPVAYWVGDSVRSVFTDTQTIGDVAYPRQGMATTNNDMFLRRWFEVDIEKTKFDSCDKEDALSSKTKWFPYNKGGSYRKWYGNNEFLVNFENDGQVICDYIDNTPGVKVGSNGRVINREHYFKPSATWSFVSSSYLGVRRSDPGFIFDVGGSSSFPPKELLNQVVGFLCSKVAFYLMRMMNPTLNFQVGNIAQLPFKSMPEIELDVESAVDKAREDWNFYEISWGYLGLISDWLSNDLEEYVSLFTAHKREMVKELTDIENSLNSKIVKKYGVEKSIDPTLSPNDVTISGNLFYRYDKDGNLSELEEREVSDTLNEIVSYAIGCMMGRYSLDEPGLIYAHSGNKGFDASQYVTFPADDDGIVPLTSMEWFDDDAANRLEEFIGVAWDSAHLEQNLSFLAENLSPKRGEGSRDTIRRYLSDKFFKDHLQTYKKRPIYWLFSSGKQKAFQCLVYLHRYNEGTLARMRTEYVIPLTAKLSAYVDKLEKDKEASDSTAEIKKLEKQIAQLHRQQAELGRFDEQLRHYADQRITLDLDDGVKVNYGKFGDLLAEVKAVTGKAPVVNIA